MIKLAWDGPKRGAPRVLLAHGAGAGMDSPFMRALAAGLSERKIGVARFEFPYMQKRRKSGKRSPPDRAPVLLDCFREAVLQLGAADELVIGGKSMGGRIASMVADELGVAGLLCLGYPFHPPGQPDKTRTEHLATLKTRGLIVQGTRDPFGTRDDVAGYVVSRKLRVVWIKDAAHDLAPRGGKLARDAAHEQMLEAAARFVRSRR